MHGIYILPCCNERSEVIGAQRYHGTDVSDTSRPFGGRGFGYAFDPIGNRTSATETIGGETLAKSYTANALNQYTAIANPDAVGLRGSATNTATVTVNGEAASRDSIASDTVPWHYALLADNADGGAYTFASIMAVVNPPGTNTPDIVESTSGSVYAPPQNETLVYDDDGNLLSDGRWHYTWNGENRLICAEEQVCPTNRTLRKVEYGYDHRGRMVWKAVSHRATEAQSWEEEKSIAYLWDSFNIIVETTVADSATNTTYNIWGLNLDGTLQGVGGVGGLLAVVKDSATYVPAWDANGNVMEYVSADGTIAAHREYDPFGGSVVVTGNADDFTHWFSTKPWCAVTHLSEYEYRKYSPVLGRWLSRDPIGENGGKNLLVCCLNNIESYIDVLGLEMRRISVVFDFTSPDEGNWISRTFNEPSGKIFVKNTADVLNWLSDLDECTCIDTITISAHGAGAGRINLGDGLFDHGNLSYLEMNSDDLGPRGKEIRNQMELAMAVLSSIKERLCDNSTMYFLICKAGEGEGGTNLREWLEQFYTEDTDIVLFPGECAFIYGIPSASPWWAPKKTRRE